MSSVEQRGVNIHEDSTPDLELNVDNDNSLVVVPKPDQMLVEYRDRHGFVDRILAIGREDTVKAFALIDKLVGHKHWPDGLKRLLLTAQTTVVDEASYKQARLEQPLLDVAAYVYEGGFGVLRIALANAIEAAKKLQEATDRVSKK